MHVAITMSARLNAPLISSADDDTGWEGEVAAAAVCVVVKYGGERVQQPAGASYIGRKSRPKSREAGGAQGCRLKVN